VHNSEMNIMTSRKGCTHCFCGGCTHAHLRHAEDISSIVLVTKERHWVKSQAVLTIAKQLKAPLPIFEALLQPLPGFFRDTVYEWISENRYNVFGEAESCRLMVPEWRDRFLS
jgi:predicted DCC family thiol-disulfide oxidoreductase YuxK